LSRGLKVLACVVSINPRDVAAVAPLSRGLKVVRAYLQPLRRRL